MTISRKSQHELVLVTASKHSCTVSVNSDGLLTANLNDTHTIDTTGEYEYQHVHFIGLEQPADEASVYTGNISILNIVGENGISAFVLHSVFTISKENLDKLSNSDIIIVPASKNEAMQKIIKKLQPAVAIFVDGFGEFQKDEVYRASLKKVFSVKDDMIQKKIKVAEQDVSGDEDGSLAYILE